MLTRNGYEISLGNFSVGSGADRLYRPIGGGVVENGVLQRGETVQTNLTLDTNSGEYSVHDFERATIPQPEYN